MPFGTFDEDRPWLEAKFKNLEFDPATGLDNETIKTEATRLGLRLTDAGRPHPVAKARAFEYVARNVRIEVDPRDWFPAFGCFDRDDRPLTALMRAWSARQDKDSPEPTALRERCNEVGTTTFWKDFDHSVPDWDAVLSLGFPGLRQRARDQRRRHAENGALGPEAAAYFDGIEIAYSAILEMLQRFGRRALERRASAIAARPADENADPPAARRLKAVADCLDALASGAPRDTYEVLQLIYLFFMFGEHIDRCQVRSLGNLDQILLPYYRRDLAEGRFTQAELRELFDYFLMQWASIDNYWGHPFYLAGTGADGSSLVNELSYLILDEYDRLRLHTPKIQVKAAANTPTAFLDKIFDMIRRGHNSLVFVCEPGVLHSMAALGFSAEEARTCDIRGCYETVPRATGNRTTVGHVNLLKAIELVLNDGVDPRTGLAVGEKTGPVEKLATFDDFLAAYFRQLDRVIEDNIRCVDDFEKALKRINPTPVYSATIQHSLQTARDAFADGSVYNLSGIGAVGIGSAADSLEMIRRLTYELKDLSLAQWRDILAADWRGHEDLRLRIRRDPNKFGNGVDSVDGIARKLVRHFSGRINRRPNARGGFYLASAHPARQFIYLGEKTGATPDGRHAGDELSKNLSPAPGMDTQGVTALLKSLSRIDSADLPGDYPLDVMLHPATVAGDEGLAAMRALLAVYMKNNGLAIHFNIFDVETLVDAQKHPENYRGLQVRVCGWNVLFNDIAKKEQDAYIERARNIAQ